MFVASFLVFLLFEHFLWQDLSLVSFSHDFDFAEVMGKFFQNKLTSYKGSQFFPYMFKRPKWAKVPLTFTSCFSGGKCLNPYLHCVGLLHAYGGSHDRNDSQSPHTSMQHALVSPHTPHMSHIQEWILTIRYICHTSHVDADTAKLDRHTIWR